jgi:hypothetical protein
MERKRDQFVVNISILQIISEPKCTLKVLKTNEYLIFTVKNELQKDYILMLTMPSHNK